jgi:hypothetical protein
LFDEGRGVLLDSQTAFDEQAAAPSCEQQADARGAACFSGTVVADLASSVRTRFAIRLTNDFGGVTLLLRAHASFASSVKQQHDSQQRVAVWQPQR